MKFGPVAILLMAAGAWPALRAELPTLNPTPLDEAPSERIPVVVVPAQDSKGAPEPHSANPVARVTASIDGGLHGGRLVAMNTDLAVGDLAYLRCTPRDANGDPTDAHGPLQAWLVSGDAPRALSDAHTLHADLRAHGPGDLRVACQVDGVTSPALRVSVHP
jgi:hypothetical protein